MIKSVKPSSILSRKKVMSLASKLYQEVSKNYDKSYSFLSTTFPDLSKENINILVYKLMTANTWGKIQSIAWKISKYHVEKNLKYVEFILNDSYFQKRGYRFNNLTLPKTENQDSYLSSNQYHFNKVEVAYTSKGTLIIPDHIKKYFNIYLQEV